MKTLVVGGNRFVGVEIAWHLLRAGHEISILALDAPPQDLRPHVRWIYANRNDEAALRAALGDYSFEAVVDNIAFEPKQIRGLVQALSARPRRYLLTSSADCYARNHPRTWRESDAVLREFELEGLDEVTRYGLGKRGCEAALSGLEIEWTVVRPCVVTGVRDNVRGGPAPRGTHWFEESSRSHFWPARVADGGPILLCSEDECVWQMAWVGDLARAVASLLTDERAIGQAYNVCGDEMWTNEGLVCALATAAGRNPDIVRVSNKLLEEVGLDYRPAYGTGATWSLADNSKLKSLGWQPTPCEKWLPRLLEAQGDPIMRMWYHTRIQEIALARRVQREQARRPKLSSEPVALLGPNLMPAKTRRPQPLPGMLQAQASVLRRDSAMTQKSAVNPREEFYRSFGPAVISSIGMGTWMGELTAAMDRQYENTLIHAACRGINVFDTAINYRHMRAERCVGRAVRRLVEMGVPREGMLIASKGGYITHDCEDSRTREQYLRQEYLQTGLIDESEMERSHSIRASFIEGQLQRSLDNLGLESIDVYFVHNPEVGIAELGHDVVIERLRQAFVVLEKAVARGTIGCYGLATWEGLRVVPTDSRHLSLTKVLHAATQAAHSCGIQQHHLRAVQLPLNVRDHQSCTVASQPVGSQMMSAVQAARAHGLYCFTSASILQGRKVAQEQAVELSEAMGGMTVSTAALQAVRSTVGVGSALVGMRRIASVEESIRLASLAPNSDFKGIQGPLVVSHTDDINVTACGAAELSAS